MRKGHVSYLPDFFQIIGQFLEDAKVPPNQKKLHLAAKVAYNNAMKSIYSAREAKIYPCTKTAKIPVILGGLGETIEDIRDLLDRKPSSSRK
jgi:hypothetical protein